MDLLAKSHPARKSGRGISGSGYYMGMAPSAPPHHPQGQSPATLFQPPVTITPKALYDLPMTVAAREIIDSVRDWKVLQETLRMELQRALPKERRIDHLRRRIDVLKVEGGGKLPSSQQGLPLAAPESVPACESPRGTAVNTASIDRVSTDGLLPMVGDADCASEIPDTGEATYARLVMQTLRDGNARVLAALLQAGHVRNYSPQLVAEAMVAAAKEGGAWDVEQQVRLFAGVVK